MGDKWIDRNDRMPEPGDDVFICNKKGERFALTALGARMLQGCEFTHWQPIELPDPPQEAADPDVFDELEALLGAAKRLREKIVDMQYRIDSIGT